MIWLLVVVIYLGDTVWQKTVPYSTYQECAIAALEFAEPHMTADCIPQRHRGK